MKILVINSGSSSLKFKVFSGEEVICKGLIEKIGSKDAEAKLTYGEKTIKREGEILDHSAAIEVMNDMWAQSGVVEGLHTFDGIGHRVVQGADLFDDSALITPDVIEKIERLAPLAPLHNPAHLKGIKEVLRVAPDVPNVAVFDTVFHQSMPTEAYIYALPWEFYEKFKVRRYGAHGTSHHYVTHKAAEFLNEELDSFNAVTLHLGNGSSISAIKGGKCFDTSMGLTPLEGVMMGTRCGSIDPAIVPFLIKNAGLSAQEVDNVMNKQSGLFAISGSNDMRYIEEAMAKGDKKAQLAFDMLTHQIVKYVGGYYALLGGAKALIFTAGIGENDDLLRAAVCERLGVFGVKLDLQENGKRSPNVRVISAPESSVKVLVVPTDEELAIANEVKKIIG